MMKFEDRGASGQGLWSTATVVASDIQTDGWLDIYSNKPQGNDISNSWNSLNSGPDKSKHNCFKRSGQVSCGYFTSYSGAQWMPVHIPSQSTLRVKRYRWRADSPDRRKIKTPIRHKSLKDNPKYSSVCCQPLTAILITLEDKIINRRDIFVVVFL